MRQSKRDLLLAIGIVVSAVVAVIVVLWNISTEDDAKQVHAQLRPSIVSEQIHKLEEKVDALQVSVNELAVKVQRLSYLIPVNAKPIQYWPGEKVLSYERFYSTVWKVLTDSPVRFADKEGFAALIIETAATESFFGTKVQQTRGPALGVFQVEPRTSKCLQENFLAFNKKLDTFTNRYVDKKSSEEDNLKYNLPYQIALCIAQYTRYGINKKNLSDKLVRAQIYKKHWNTVNGSGSVVKFFTDSEKYLANYYKTL